MRSRCVGQRRGFGLAGTCLAVCLLLGACESPGGPAVPPELGLTAAPLPAKASKTTLPGADELRFGTLLSPRSRPLMQGLALPARWAPLDDSLQDPAQPWALLGTDLDGDADLEALVVLRQGATVAWLWLQREAASFAAPRELARVAPPTAACELAPTLSLFEQAGVGATVWLSYDCGGSQLRTSLWWAYGTEAVAQQHWEAVGAELPPAPLALQDQAQGLRVLGVPLAWPARPWTEAPELPAAVPALQALCHRSSGYRVSDARGEASLCPGVAVQQAVLAAGVQRALAAGQLAQALELAAPLETQAASPARDQAFAALRRFGARSPLARKAVLRRALGTHPARLPRSRLAFSPDGRRLEVGTQPPVSLDLASGVVAPAPTAPAPFWQLRTPDVVVLDAGLHCGAPWLQWAPGLTLSGGVLTAEAGRRLALPGRWHLPCGSAPQHAALVHGEGESLWLALGAQLVALRVLAQEGQPQLEGCEGGCVPMRPLVRRSPFGLVVYEGPARALLTPAAFTAEGPPDVALSPDGRLLAFATMDAVYVYERPR